MAVNQQFEINIKVNNLSELQRLEDALGKTTKQTSALVTGAKLAAGALAAIATGKFIQGVVQSGIEAERLNTQLKLLFGSATAGAKAFETVNKFASKVPYTFDQIQKAALPLSLISAGAKELGQNLEIVANLAAVAGLDFETAADQFRLLASGGIDAANLLQKKGVDSLLGFTKGVQYSASESVRIAREKLGPGGEFENASKDFGKTLEGQIAILQKSFSNFQETISKTFVNELRKSFGDVNQFIAQNQQSINTLAEFIGKTLAFAVQGAAAVIKFLTNNLELLNMALGVAGVYIFIRALDTMLISVEKLTAAVQLLNVSLNNIGTGGLLGRLGAIGALLLGIIDYAKRAKEMTDKLGRPGGAAFENEDDAAARDEQEEQRKIKLRQQAAAKELADFLRLNQSKLEAIEQLGESEVEAVQRQYAERIQLLQERIRLEVEFEQRGQELMVKAREDAEKRIREIRARQDREDRQRQDENLDKVRKGKAYEIDATKVTENEKNKLIFAAGETILEQAATQSKKAFQAYKALQVAKAVVAGYQSALQSYAFGASIGGPIVGAIFAAASVAVTASQINAIKAQQYQGRRFGGGVTGNTPYIVGENGPEVMVPGKTGTVIPNGQAFGGQQAVNVNFNITTIDAKDFDTLLRARQGVIIGVINQALNEKGRRALV